MDGQKPGLRFEPPPELTCPTCKGFARLEIGDCRRPSKFDWKKAQEHEILINVGATCLALGREMFHSDGSEDPEYIRQKDLTIKKAIGDFRIWKQHIQEAEHEYPERVRREKHARQMEKEQERAMKKERAKQGKHAEKQRK